MSESAIHRALVPLAGGGGSIRTSYEPSSRDGLVEARPAGAPHTPYVAGPVVRQKLARTNDYAQAGERYRTMESWEREDLIHNLVTNLARCNDDIQERMIGHLTQCDEDYGRRVAAGLGRPVPAVQREAVPAD